MLRETKTKRVSRKAFQKAVSGLIDDEADVADGFRTTTTASYVDIEYTVPLSTKVETSADKSKDANKRKPAKKNE